MVRITRKNDKVIWLPKDLLKRVQLVARIKKGKTMKSYITEVLEKEVGKELAGIDEKVLLTLLGINTKDDEQVSDE